MPEDKYTCCSDCEQIGLITKISSPGNLKTILTDLRRLISDKKLSENSFESSRALIGQPKFEEISVNGPYPDVMIYYFECDNCKNAFELTVDTYHGSGGSIKTIGNLDS